MVENIIYALSPISILAGILWLTLQKIWGGASVKSYFRTARITVFISMFFAVLFYNKTVYPQFFEITPFTVLFYFLTTVISFVWLSLSLRWFVSEDEPAYGFSVLSLTALLCFFVLITTINLAVMFTAVSGLMLINYAFLRFSQESEELHNLSGRYGWSAMFFLLLMSVSLCLLGVENWNYGTLQEYIGAAGLQYTGLVVGAIVLLMVFMLGIAPLHFWFADVVAPAVLPVAAYFNLVPMFALWATFIKINLQVLSPMAEELRTIYNLFGILSVIVGAIGANASRNLRKMFAYGGLYNIGVILLMIATFNPEAVLGGFVYMQVYVLALFGVYISFYSFKSGGDYLQNLNMINGIYKVRPFIAGAMLFFMVSLMGIAPLAGFLGQLAALNTFMHSGQFGFIVLILGAMLILMIAYLQIIKSMFFLKRTTDFDRTDRGIYIYLLINILLLAVLIVEPQFLLRNATVILQTVLN